jgi:hypothetical protein
MKQSLKNYLQNKNLAKPDWLALFIISVLALNCLAAFLKLSESSLNWEIFVYHFLKLLTLPGFFLLLRQLRISRKITFLGTFLLAISAWRIASFDGCYIESLGSLFIIWGFYFLLKWQKGDFKLFPIFAGVLLGTGAVIAWQSALSIALLLLIFFNLTKKDGFKSFSSLQVFLFILCFFLSISFFYSFQYLNLISSPTLNNYSAVSWRFTAENIGRLSSFYLLEEQNPQIPIIPPAWMVLLTVGILLSCYKTIKLFCKLKKISRTFSNFFTPEIFSHLLIWPTLFFGIFLAQLNQEFIPKHLQIIVTMPAIIILIIMPLEYLTALQKKIKTSKSKSLKPKRLQFLNLTIAGLLLLAILSGLLDFLAIIKL